MGFLHAIKPGLDIIHSDINDKENAYMRHMEYFNTNPYFSSIVMGVTLSLEERLNKGEIAEEIIHDTKEGLMTACAAIGDSLFWDSWRPFVAVIAIILAFNNVLFTPLIFLLIYNIPHIYFRFAGIFWGYNQGTHVIRKLRAFKIPQIRKILRYGTITALCYLIPNHVNLHTPYLLSNFPMEYFYFGEKFVQGVGAFILVGLGIMAYRAKIDVLMISFLLMVSALVFYHWGILI